ncbi:UNVERIFIED_CONTAM: Vacuole membrane protein KMS1 [Sesamum calycinum]|uniref:Vacuole membrane protein KMS1 n=1 Tax=Sesamum calycinum TaxID=2727403 RepID=A0AAW2R8Y3_9LAMI
MGLRIRHQQELEKLTLTSQPLKTLKLFFLAVRLYLRQSAAYLLSHGGWLMLLSTIFVICGVLLVTVDGPHEKHVEEVQRYIQFALWWVALGVASSIGLGSGLHTFVLYLGPHIALFTIKAIQCGRADIKTAPYDTIQLKRGPSWLKKDCADFGPPLFQSSHGERVPLSSILPQVQLEAILWGIGTALGELPPYFISRAARLSGGTVDTMELGASLDNGGFISARLNQIKRWFLLHAQYLNFFTILVLASVPNPLFDLAGIMCGQFGIPFWKFFLATAIGKAIIKTHIQVSKWDFSLASIWNTIVWIMLMNFSVKIVNSTAQQYLKQQQDREIAALKNKSSQHSDEADNLSR